MLEAVLDQLDEGVVILDDDAGVLFWNAAATSLTGYTAQELHRRTCPDTLYRVDEAHHAAVESSLLPPKDRADECLLQSPTLVSMGHKLGHSVPCMLRKVQLHQSPTQPAGAALLFYPVEEADALPHGEQGEDATVERSQAEMEDRLDAAHHQWAANRMPFGLLWILVDQAEALRKSHGKDACDAMLHTIEQTLLRQMKPGEIIGRWGAHEFLILSHERTADLLAERARRLAGLARTADFRWWGDRVGLTVSVGTSQAAEASTLQSLLQDAQHAMQASKYAGGNQVTEARG